MTTITIPYSASDAAELRVKAALDHITKTSLNWNGAVFDIERDEFVSIKDNDSYDANILLQNVNAALNASGAGRPQLMAGGKAVRVYLDAASLASAKLLGVGNVSEGIRIALQRNTK